jgi:hypothetical protein
LKVTNTTPNITCQIKTKNFRYISKIKANFSRYILAVLKRNTPNFWLLNKYKKPATPHKSAVKITVPFSHVCNKFSFVHNFLLRKYSSHFKRILLSFQQQRPKKVRMLTFRTNCTWSLFWIIVGEHAAATKK